MLTVISRAGGAALRRAAQCSLSAGLHGASAAAVAAADGGAPVVAAAPAFYQQADWDLTEDQQQFKHVAEEFAREELAPFRCGGAGEASGCAARCCSRAFGLCI